MLKMKGYNSKKVKADVPGTFGGNPLATRTNPSQLTTSKDGLATPKKILGVNDFLRMMKDVAPKQGV